VQPDPDPFGTPGLRARSLSASIPLREASSPVGAFERLRACSSAGSRAVLLESLDRLEAGSAEDVAPRSLIAHRPLLSLTLVGGVVTIEVLDPRGRPLLKLLAGRLGAQPAWSGRVSFDGADTARAVCPDAHGRPDLDDEERLRLASCFDVVRELAGIVGLGKRGLERHGRGMPPGVFGAFGHDLVDHFEPLPPRPEDESSPLGSPDFALVYACDLVVYEGASVSLHSRVLPWEDAADAESRHRADLELLRGDPAECVTGGEDSTVLAARPDVSDDAFRRAVRSMHGHVLAGDVFQGVVSRGLEVESDEASLAVYRRLRRRNPSPYMFHVGLGATGDDEVLLGASPETFVRVEGRQVEVRPIAGTIRRGLRDDGSVDDELDARLAMQLLLDHKEQAEHAMLVDLARNDVARVAKPGTTRVVESFAIQKFSHVQHLVSRVRGTMRPGLDALHAYRAAANAGTLTGAPKLRAVEILRALEPSPRGFYGGAVGYLLQDGQFDSCIVIRALHKRGRNYSMRTGAGVVFDSTPDGELEETRAKARACLHVLGAALPQLATSGGAA
jgi:anthranilate synthase component 1